MENKIKEGKITITWEDFKEDKIAVACYTEEEAKDFLSQCNKQGLTWVSGESLLSKTCFNAKYGTCYLCDSDGISWAIPKVAQRENKTIIKWNIKENVNMNTEKTFREVIADIKECEVWESVQDCFQLSEITCFEGRIRFRLKNVFVDIVDGNNNVDTGAGGGQTFKLKRKEYTFEEAYKNAKEGLEIESLVSGIKYKKYDENTMMFKDDDMDDFSGVSNHGALFSVDEINGKWYINN